MRNPFEVYTSLTKGKNPRPLDWDESALDSQKKTEGILDEERQAPPLWGLGIILLGCFLVLGGRIFFLQIVHGSQMRILSENNRVRDQVILAPRGLIKDSYGQTLAQNTASFDLVAIPFDLPKQGLAEEISALATELALTSPPDIQKQLASVDRNSVDPITIQPNLDHDKSILFDTDSGKFPGFEIRQIPIRQYLDPQAFSAVLGYTGAVGPNDVQSLGLDSANYDVNDFIGKSGIEQSYEKYLHGTNGESLVEVDSAGKPQTILGQNDPQPGDTLTLNIDQGLQELLYNELSNKQSPRAAAIAMDPKTGQVLALVSLPGFDNNSFAQGITQQQYSALLSDLNLPLFNRAIAGTYPPGSTVKPMVATAGLHEGVITENTKINDNGDLIVPNQFDPSIKYQFHGWKPGGLGSLTVRQAIALSSDIFFYQVAGGDVANGISGLGAEKLAQYYRKFGLGKPLGIDLPGEKGGLVPDPEWKAQYYKNDPVLSQWYLGDTYHMGIGQGDLLVTPLQVAEWTSIVANGGTGYKPEVAQKVTDQNGKIIWENSPQVVIASIAPESIFQIVQEGMRQTVVSGTAKPLNSLPITSAGKTGTSQFDGANPSKTHAWFTAYAPYENPQIVITVLVEAGGEGNAVAEPVVKDALQWWAQNRYNK